MSNTPRTDALCEESEQRAEKAEAELERIYAGMQGSCYCCEPVGEMNQKLEAEVERLNGQLKRVIEIADEFWNNQKQAVLIHHQELADELEQFKELEKSKGEIK